MRLIYCALLMALTGMPVSVMAADAPSNEEIAKRLKDLDSRMDRLERRERAENKRQKEWAEKKADAKGKGTGASKASREPTAAQWQQVKIGMGEEQVVKILGQPDSKRMTAEHEIWTWKSGANIWLRDRTAERVNRP